MITRLAIPKEYLRVSACGKEMEFVRTPEVEAILKDHYGRDGLCLKMLGRTEHLNQAKTDWQHAWGDGSLWGGVALTTVTPVQNIYSWYGLAPRVYGLVVLNSERAAQVVDFAKGTGRPRVAKAQQVAAKYRLAVKGGDINKQLAESHRWIGGKIVDFGRFHFSDPKWYQWRMRQHVIRYHKKPHKKSLGYHPCPELGVKGVREIESRIKMMRWDDYEWKGRTVLDVGCNSCAFAREATRRGAARVIAVDYKGATKNRELDNWLGYWNIDHLQILLPKEWKQIRRKTGIKRFDTVICLSMVGHAGGYKRWLPALCDDLLFFSGQGNEERSKYQAKLDRDFAEAEWRGYATDNGRHPVWVCHKQHAQGVATALDEPLEA